MAEMGIVIRMRRRAAAIKALEFMLEDLAETGEEELRGVTRQEFEEALQWLKES